MQQLIESGAIVDWLLLLVAIEVVMLSLYWIVTKRGLAPAAVLLNIGAGTCLMLSLRAALMQQGWQMISSWLLVALVFHLGDLWYRWSSINRSLVKG